MSKGNVPAMTEFTITDATEADIPDVLAIARASFPDPWSEQNYRSALAYSVFCIARLEGKTVGFCVVNVSADEAELYDIAVTEELRGSGAATALLTEALAKAVTLGAKTVYLEVREGNGRAIAFYEKHGFSRLGIRKNYYASPKENALLMSLSL